MSRSHYAPSDATALARGGARAWLAVAGVWTALALMSASQVIAERVFDGQPSEWERVLPRTLADWYTCAIFTPAIVWLVHRAPPSVQRWPRTLGVYGAGAAAFVLLKSALYLPFSRALSPAGRAPSWAELVTGNAFALTLTFAAVAGAAVALESQRRAREKEVRAGQLEARLAQVQLQTLRAQLNPHFLFNALNALSALIHSNPAAADRMVLRLGDLLRHSLDAADTPEVPLGDEVQLLERYLDVMKIRLGERLQVRMELEPGTQAAAVPNLLLQPIVENALQHGIGRRPGAGRLRVAAFRERGSLVLEVEDDGPGIPPRVEERVGLGNTRLRLRQLYGDAQRLTLERREEGGTRARIVLPFRVAPPAAEAAEAAA
ncbi:MAG TPA: histidine kinase [Longimicrobium sp.]|nr:histidine kinase [Longimicrobium sp.]